MIIKDLGAVSAYAYAVEKGYTGTEEEYAELMASYATVAEEAAESAQSASQSAESASASAQTATTKASEASTSATQAGASATSASQSASTATTKASEASASASTAGTKASEASASATTASSKASQASQSASDAQTAQGLAESARDDAIDAKTDAESARDLAQQYAESIDPDNIFSAYATDTASGDVASFADGADDIPMKSVVVNIEPVQSGSGDPSPDNIRPISGWTGAQVVRTGKNLFDLRKFAEVYPEYCSYDESTGELTLTSNGALFQTGVQTSILLYVSNGGYLQYEAKNESGSNFRFRIIYEDRRISGDMSGGTGTETEYVKIENSIYAKKIVAICANWSNGGVFKIRNFCLTFGTSAVDYEPYTGDTYSITLPTEAGTVYGGTLDVTNGVLTVDRGIIASYNGETLPSEWISDRDKYVAGTTPTTGAQVVYKLATPITYHLTPTEIKSLLGDNNVWADAGDSTVEYRADTAKYIDKKIAEAVNALS